MERGQGEQAAYGITAVLCYHSEQNLKSWPSPWSANSNPVSTLIHINQALREYLKRFPAQRLHTPPCSLTPPKAQEVPYVIRVKYILLTHRSNLKGLKIISEKSATELFPLLLLCFLSYYQQYQFQTTSNL